MTGLQFLANNAAQLLAEVAGQIDTAAVKDKRIAELEAEASTLKERIVELEKTQV